MNYNKVVSVKDYPGLLGHEPPFTRKEWEVQMALRTLKDHGVAHGNAEILGAGAGYERTIYLLSTQVKRVFATDLYLNPGDWKAVANTEVLGNPAKFAPHDVEYDLKHIVFQHANMLDLPYPDGTFDGIFSSGSIEHVGTMENIAKAASELGRVLKPGGILSISTEFKISGDGDGFHNVRLLDYNDIMTYIVKPSGCEMVDDLVTDVDDDTLATAWQLRDIVIQKKRPEIEAVLRHDHYLFTSVHLALKKPDVKGGRYSRTAQAEEAVTEEETPTFSRSRRRKREEVVEAEALVE